MRKTVRVLENISEWTGKIAMWFCLLLVLMLSFEVFMRYVLGNPTIYSYSLSQMMGLTIAAGGLAFAHKYQAHVRVDVLWKNLSVKGKAIADVIGAFLFFFPFISIIVYISAVWALRSFREHEILTQTYLYPPAWPVRTVMMLGFLFFLPQGVAKLIRDIFLIAKGEEI